MKFLIVVAVCVALSAGSAIPLIPGDNSHYVEGVSRYIWMPNDDDVPQLVDLHAPVDHQVLSSRNGANNQYWLFTRQNPTNHQILTNGNINSVRNSNYNGGRPTKVIVHGWNNNGNSGVNTVVRDAFLAALDCNIIVVDWRGLANNINYASVVNGVPSVGQHIGNFLVWLIDNAGGNWNQLHLVGYSLGAHAVGIAGRQAGGRPSRITGLDPAGPLWTTNSDRLSSNAGRYVEAIHTDGVVLGIMIRSGDADFYPNGGRSQPGCSSSSCNHSRAYQFMAASIRYNRLVGRQCSSLVQANSNSCTGSTLNMGNAITSKSGSGMFALTTGSGWPF